MSKIHTFEVDLSQIPLPQALNNPFCYAPDAFSLAAAAQLQAYLSSQRDWQHNFNSAQDNERPIGKMFGILVVQKQNSEIGFLAAFSGKLAGKNHHEYFVPPVFDSLSEESFLNSGMRELKVMNDEVKSLKAKNKNSEGLSTEQLNTLNQLKQKRQQHSRYLLAKLFDAYSFKNKSGKSKTATQLFTNPPAGAGECAAPKLLQYAFTQNLKPIAIAEFWWGSPPSIKNIERQHANFYPACAEKCKTILTWMLS